MIRIRWFVWAIDGGEGGQEGHCFWDYWQEGWRMSPVQLHAPSSNAAGRDKNEEHLRDDTEAGTSVTCEGQRRIYFHVRQASGRPCQDLTSAAFTTSSSMCRPTTPCHQHERFCYHWLLWKPEVCMKNQAFPQPLRAFPSCKSRLGAVLTSASWEIEHHPSELVQTVPHAKAYSVST